MKNNFKHILVALLTAIGITGIFALCIPFLPKGNYAELVYFFVGIGLFVVSFIFYFVFIFFKSIQKLKWLFGGIVLLIFTSTFSLFGFDIYFKNLFNSKNLPQEYNQYIELDSINKPIRFGNHEMTLLFEESHEPIAHFISSKNNLIVITSQIPKDRNAKEIKEDFGVRTYQDIITYKFNKNGDIIDKHIYKRTRENYNEELFDDYIVNIEKEYYKTWVLDGDTVKKPFEFQNKDLKWNKEQQINLFQKIINEAKYYSIIDEDYTEGEHIPKQEIIYFMENKWYKLFTYCELPDHNRKDTRGKSSYYNNIFKEYFADEMELSPKDFSYNNIYYRYFQKVKLERGYASCGGNTGWETTNWDGYLFANLIVGKDTLKLKRKQSISDNYIIDATHIHDMEIDKYFKDEDLNPDIPYMFYSNKDFNFRLFTNNPYSLFIIKHK